MHFSDFCNAAVLPVLLALVATAQAQSACASSLRPTATPKLAAGWEARLVANGLTTPRGIIFDSAGRLIISQQGNGLVHLALNDGGGTCISVSKKTNLISNNALNHGVAISADGRTLYASSQEAVFSYPYNATGPTLGAATTLITGMTNAAGGHSTRTLLMSQKFPGLLLVSFGSAANLDAGARDIKTGHSQIKAFNVTGQTKSVPYTSSGRLMGWGLRNSVGIGEEPTTGGIFSVENSADQVTRSGTDVHQNNPGEELNFHGFLNESTADQGGNYGYPDCFALWDKTNFPNVGNLKVGSQFAMQQTATLNDTTCLGRVGPRITFAAHMAPLDVKFSNDGKTGFVTFHGSWNRDIPIGYKVSAIAFANGQPVAASDSTTAAVDIMYNADNTRCPTSCFRPVGIAVDSKGRVFVTSDATGELWVLRNTATAA